MRTYKASKDKRTQYTYHTATGEKIQLTTDEVDQKWLDLLHADDDAVIDAERRELYHCPGRYDSLTGIDEADLEKSSMLATPEEDFLERIIKKAKCQELMEAIQTLQPQQIELIHKVYYEDRTCASIAADEGVSRAALSIRLKKIHAALAKKLVI